MGIVVEGCGWENDGRGGDAADCGEEERIWWSEEIKQKSKEKS